MACCILGALILAQFLAFRRKLGALFGWSDLARPNPALWRLGVDTPDSESRLPLAPRWAGAGWLIAPLAGVAGYFGVLHADHLAAAARSLVVDTSAERICRVGDSPLVAGADWRPPAHRTTL